MPPEAAARLRSGAKEILGRELTDDEVVQVGSYVGELLTWQQAIRLVGRADPNWIVEDLVLDSLLFLRLLPRAAGRVVDLGSGAGIPGIPLKIVEPGLMLWLVEARRKRASFLSSAVRRLGWTGVEVIGMRAEEALRNGSILSHSFDAVVARCAGRVSDIVGIGRDLAKDGGVLVVAGPSAPVPPPAGARWTSLIRPWDHKERGFLVIEIAHSAAGARASEAGESKKS